MPRVCRWPCWTRTTRPGVSGEVGGEGEEPFFFGDVNELVDMYRMGLQASERDRCETTLKLYNIIWTISTTLAGRGLA